MTIAVCYLSDEGVVLGADSTSTAPQGSGLPDQYFDHQQKVLEIGENSTLGLVMWGLGGLTDKSYRTLTAEFSDELIESPLSSVEETARKWAEKFWGEYMTAFRPLIERYNELRALDTRSDRDGDELMQLESLSGGFCIGGRMGTNRRPEAYSVTYGPSMSLPEVTPLTYNEPRFWGVPNLMERLIYGMDNPLFDRIMKSELWTGTAEELITLVRPGMLSIPGRLPLREAIDWVYSTIFITIKAIKFSGIPPVCGGPIEIAVITSDRRFRWVKHKRLDEVLRSISRQGEIE